MRFLKLNSIIVLLLDVSFRSLNNKSIETMNVVYESFVMINVQVLTNF